MMELLFGIPIMHTQIQHKETPGNTRTNLNISSYKVMVTWFVKHCSSKTKVFTPHKYSVCIEVILGLSQNLYDKTIRVYSEISHTF